MKLMKIVDEDVVVETDALYCDGYSFGDQMLEGLPVKITVNQEGNLQISADWPKGLDAEYWNKTALRCVMNMAEREDTFSTTSTFEDDDGYIIFDKAGD